MDLLSKKTRSEKRAHWKKLLLDWKISGLSQADFCKQHNIAYGSFSWWRRRLKSCKPELESAPTMIPVSVRPVAQPSSERIPSIRIILCDGKRIDLPLDVSIEQLRVVMSSL